MFAMADSDDDDFVLTNLDGKAAEANLNDFMQRIEEHITVEKGLIQEWKAN